MVLMQVESHRVHERRVVHSVPGSVARLQLVILAIQEIERVDGAQHGGADLVIGWAPLFAATDGQRRRLAEIVAQVFRMVNITWIPGPIRDRVPVVNRKPVNQELLVRTDRRRQRIVRCDARARSRARTSSPWPRAVRVRREARRVLRSQCRHCREPCPVARLHGRRCTSDAGMAGERSRAARAQVAHCLCPVLPWMAEPPS
jgi:hypothetical protein